MKTTNHGSYKSEIDVEGGIQDQEKLHSEGTMDEFVVRAERRQVSIKDAESQKNRGKIEQTII